ncbi:hypothetical protein XM38_037860 [Halomicronema hongdechloris C2206]|uniref:Uncharacterized protein n=1 Tax=Halomicronema hongdechloris C2206 TaxID=1641165 RepID=A0A1Z3HRS3_9CYAN|nr:hypothetical protein [Halomicronema hongdechloris]ASC72827.1 hypothetical protein XM38_037860 [Halomicronema hongdechloris C2206]
MPKERFSPTRAATSKSVNADESFDFDTWAQAVRQQMMEALKRRNNNS